MSLQKILLLLAIAALGSGCSQIIKPNYTSAKPDIMRVGGNSPADPKTTVENAGSFCLETSDKWHQDGETPDGQALWAKDTARKVVPCK